MSDRATPKNNDFTIGWICALPVELAAAQLMLDVRYDDCEGHMRQGSYTLGSVGKHHIVITHPPAGHIGTTPAAVSAAQLLSDFRSIRFCLMVGIGGGVPTSVPDHDMRLGDVVVSKPDFEFGGVVQYDLGKTGPGGAIYRTGSLNSPSQALLKALATFQSNRFQNRSSLDPHLKAFADYAHFSPRDRHNDVLFQAAYAHCNGISCSACDVNMQIPRPTRLTLSPEIHYGTIASGNQVMKDGETRDVISKRLGGVLCFEMEAAGLMNNFSCLVVRGICDYADSHKNKGWQGYAAATAAACAKEILLQVQASNVLYGTPNDSAKSPMTDGVEERRKQLILSLEIPGIQARHDTIRDAHAGTCDWLLEQSEYRCWLDPSQLQQHHGFLWIKGNAGTGKSTLMKFAYNQAARGMPDATVLGFFFNARGEELEKSTEGLYRTLLFQLMIAMPDLRATLDILSARSLGPKTSGWKVEDLRCIFLAAVKRLGHRSLVCFIDALDECDEDQARDMVDYFEDMGQIASETGIAFRVCFASRHYPYIEIQRSLELVLQEQEGHREDMKEYLRTKLNGGQSRKIDRIRHEVLERSSGIFLWVVLVVRILNTVQNRGASLDDLQQQLKQRLRDIPKGLNELFADILTRDNENMQALYLCVQWVLFACRRLSCKELCFAIESSREPTGMVAWNPAELDQTDMERRILHYSKGLVEFTKSKARRVQFIHESVRDYLLNGQGLQLLRCKEVTAQAHKLLERSCEAYIRAVAIDTNRTLPTGWRNRPSNRCALGLGLWLESRSKVSSTYPFREYAIDNVLYHAKQAQSSAGVDRILGNFPLQDWLDLHILFNWTGSIPSTASTAFLAAMQRLPNLLKMELSHAPPSALLCAGAKWLEYFLHGVLACQNFETVEACLEFLFDEQGNSHHAFSGFPAEIERMRHATIQYFCDNGFTSMLSIRDRKSSLEPGFVARDVDRTLAALKRFFGSKASPFVSREAMAKMLCHVKRDRHVDIFGFLLGISGQMRYKLTWSKPPGSAFGRECARRGYHLAVLD